MQSAEETSGPDESASQTNSKSCDRRAPGGSQAPPERAALIDLTAIAANVERIKEIAAPAKLIAIVKADAYGHGAIPVARTALEAGADALGLVHVREALDLRSEGIDGRMLAWLHTHVTDFDAALENDIELGVSGWDLDAAADAASRTGIPAKIHLKIDTGLGRNGCTVDDWPELVDSASKLESEGLIRVVGIFSHLAVADEPERPETDSQLDLFEKAVRVARDAGLNPELTHLANSPGTLTAERYSTGDRNRMTADAVRVGVALYGLSPIPDTPPEAWGLRPAMTLQTFISSVKEVPAGQGVSYGLRYNTTEPTTLALIPVGYADGVPRIATGGPVRIYPKGAEPRTFPEVGRIAMDQMVVDLGRPGLSDPALGYLHAPVVLFGSGENPSVDEWAAAAGTINYEIVTRISPRVDRIYLREDNA
ncbi:alanine racemase [Rothia uropygialis]|uniref:alanine racemase n=1 Tax=Kocuria sp. 36 TaxID=1415402 RepID=UPI00101CC134|nr:alanine racemase [Kocuria sp. 36]